MNRLTESKAMLEVWKWKDECYREVAHLPLREALARRLRDSRRPAESLPIQLPMSESSRRWVLAEPHAVYEAAGPRDKATESSGKTTNRRRTPSKKQSDCSGGGRRIDRITGYPVDLRCRKPKPKE